MTETIKIEGTVSAVSMKENGWSIKVNDDWYGYFGKTVICPNKGDYVIVDYVQSGRWKNIEDITNTGGGSINKGGQQAREDKATTMILSYMKDQVIASMSYLSTKNISEANLIDGLWDQAYKNVMQNYNKIKENINPKQGGQDEDSRKDD